MIEAYNGKRIQIYEWPHPCCEIYDKQREQCAKIDTIEDAEAVIESLTSFIYTKKKLKEEL